MSHVMTVLGPIEPSALGHTQVHEHLLLDSNRARFVGDLDKVLAHPEIAVDELTAYERAGGGTLVEVTTPDLGRDPAGLRWIAERSRVHIVMGVGLYREPYYPEWVDWISTDELARLFVREIRSGVTAGRIRPGIIGEIGSHRAWVSAREERVFRAAGRAQAETGLPVMTHTPPGAARQHLDLLEAEGADLRKVVVGHADTWLDEAYHLEIAARGAFLSFDHCGLGVYPDEWRAQHVAGLVRRGLTSQILLSSDLFTRRRLLAWGGKGYAFVLTSFLPLLRAAGVGEAELVEITVENPRRLLTVERPASEPAEPEAVELPLLYPWGLVRPLEGNSWVPRDQRTSRRASANR